MLTVHLVRLRFRGRTRTARYDFFTPSKPCIGRGLPRPMAVWTRTKPV